MKWVGAFLCASLLLTSCWADYVTPVSTVVWVSGYYTEQAGAQVWVPGHYETHQIYPRYHVRYR